MACFVLRRFSCPETLKAIAPENLLAFLKPFHEYLAVRGLPLPDQVVPSTLDYPALATTFLASDERTPRELINALYLVDELATAEGMDALLQEAHREGLDLDDGADHSPADVAVQVWLRNHDLVERKHAENHLVRVRSFESYQTDRSPPQPFPVPTESQLARFAATLDEWFEGKKRGRGARVLTSEREDGLWFLVRHGEPFKREESINDGAASSVCYRPLKYDVLVYQPAIGELRINARSKGEKQLYRSEFGQIFFGDPDFFPGTEKYTLQPLREDGEAALSCEDVSGIEWVKLKEVQFFHPGQPWEITSLKSDDVFALLRARGRDFPASGRLTRGTFQIKFTDARMPRTAVIRPSNVAQFSRDDDSPLVEAWLEARGFILPSGAEEGGHRDPVLAGH